MRIDLPSRPETGAAAVAAVRDCPPGTACGKRWTATGRSVGRGAFRTVIQVLPVRAAIPAGRDGWRKPSHRVGADRRAVMLGTPGALWHDRPEVDNRLHGAPAGQAAHPGRPQGGSLHEHDA
ncbi:MAG: hypothetical protein IT495_02835 [Gammaproteobacteria bacterium]|nr:hypothetical protein [Gammaproteobacteria bacterium]